MLMWHSLLEAEDIFKGCRVIHKDINKFVTRAKIAKYFKEHNYNNKLYSNSNKL